MSTRHKALVLLLLVSLLTAGCGPAEPTATSVPATATRIALGTTNTPQSLTATPAPPTATPVPPTPVQTPLSTATPAPPTPTKESTPTPTQLPRQPASVAEVVASLEGLSIDEFLVESYRQLRLRDPDILFVDGFGDVYGVELDDRFTDMSADYIHETQQLESEILNLLRTYDRNELTTDQTISYDALEWYLATHVRGHAFADLTFLVNPVWGLQDWPIGFLMEFPLENRHDVEQYIARISSLDSWVDHVIERLKRNEKAGAIPPKYVLEDTIDQIDAILKTRGTKGVDAAILDICTNLRSKIHEIDELGEEERESLLASALTEVEDAFIPAYQSLRDHLVTLTSIAVEDPNQWQLPGGEEYYAYLLQYHTGTDSSADEIHALALAEVAKIQEDIRDAAAEVGYPPGLSMAELNQRIHEDTPLITGSALRQEYERLLADADQAAEDYFDLRTSAEVVVRSVRGGPPAYYISPEPGSSDPGVMPVNLGLSPSIVNYNEHVLVHHETIPGHHTQIALAQELDLPLHQRFYSVHPAMQEYDFLAYTEGWALYSEVLAWEMGLYEGEPLANLWRLRLYLLRTVRAVVDTGIHAKGWTLDEATAYLEEVTGMPQNRAMMTRYLVNPGYACSYNVAKLKLFEMRQRAMEQLGDAFDIKEFHNVVLGNGIMPIGILEDAVNDWIEAKLSE